MNLLQDLRFSLRTLVKSPIFTSVAILSLALGVGANTAIFTLMDQVLYRMLPVAHPEQLVLFDQPGPNQGSIWLNNAFSYPMYVDLRDHNNVFSGMLARFPLSMSVAYHGATGRADGELVSGNYFDVLGVRPFIGRTFTHDDDRTPGARPIVFFTYGYWKRQFGGDPSILNQTVLVNGYPMTVVGVGPPGFRGVEAIGSTDLMAPIMMKAQMTPTWNALDQRRTMWLNVIARIKNGVSREQASAGINVAYHHNLELEVNELKGWSQKDRLRFLKKQLVLLPGQRGQASMAKQFSAPLLVLMAMVGLVLLIACANLANLMIARAAGRQKEIAVRLALGAGRARIVRQLLVESLALALCGGAAGLLMASWAASLLLQVLPLEAVRHLNTEPDLRILGFNFAVAIVAGLVFGLAPAAQTTRPNLSTTLKDQAGNLSGTSAHVRFRKGLVVAQIALSMLLMTGAGLFVRSLYNLKNLDPGFHTENVMTFSVDASLNGYSQDRTQRLYARLQDDMRRLPGVRNVSMAENPPLTDNINMSTITVEGYHAKEDEDMNPRVNTVGPGYFATLGIPVIAGREFRESDRIGAPLVGMMNETAARYFFHNQNPLGRHFGFGGARGIADIEIVGVVKDDKSAGLKETVPRFVYAPYMQEKAVTQLTYYVRTSQAPEQTAGALRRVVAQQDPNLPVFDMKTMSAQVNEFLFTERLIAMLSSFFGLLATLLAAIGLYGVMTYTVSRRTREIGIRIALGAERRSVVRLVMQEVALMAAIGIGLGLPCAIALSRLVESQLFGLQPADPGTLAMATATLVAVSMISGYIPAMRATRIDPVRALRYE